MGGKGREGKGKKRKKGGRKGREKGREGEGRERGKVASWLLGGWTPLAYHSIRIAKKFQNFKTIAYNNDVHSNSLFRDNGSAP